MVGLSVVGKILVGAAVIGADVVAAAGGSPIVSVGWVVVGLAVAVAVCGSGAGAGRDADPSSASTRGALQPSSSTTSTRRSIGITRSLWGKFIALVVVAVAVDVAAAKY